MNINRRQFQIYSGLGFASLGMKYLLAEEQETASSEQFRIPPTARSVIFLFMSGGPSQVDTFDPKPELKQLAGKDVPESIAARVPPIKRAGLKNLMESNWDFAQQGESGLWVSSLFPETAKHIDKLCVIRSMTHRNPVHGPGECVALTGTGTGDRPSLGAWSTYGLGSKAKDLPAFIAMNLHTDGMQHPQAAGWGPGFLPSRYQGTVVDSKNGIQNVLMPAGVKSDQREQELAAIKKLNESFLERVQHNSELEARIRSYEVAARLQTAAPELFDLAQETNETQANYGMDQDASREVGRACLLARRMVEREVPFIQIRVGGWDAHGNIKGNHERMAARTDQPVAALLQDLQQRGLLDSTLLVWGGEFGRTPTMEGRGKGRDHSPAAYTMWLAGGGVRGGQTIGETDPIGYTVVDRPVKPQDLHATILHCMGLDSSKLIFNHHGLMENPVGVEGGAVVSEVLS